MKVDSQTLWDQVQGLARHLEPVLERLHDHILSKEVVLVDETRWPVPDPKGRRTKNWFVWSLTSDDAVLYKIKNGYSNQEGEAILQSYRGVAAADCSSSQWVKATLHREPALESSIRESDEVCRLGGPRWRPMHAA
ncbi:MAG: transposase [Myxococcota bacterium]